MQGPGLLSLVGNSSPEQPVASAARTARPADFCVPALFRAVEEPIRRPFPPPIAQDGPAGEAINPGSDSKDRRNGKKEWDLGFHDLFELRQFAVYEADLLFEKIIAKARRLKECQQNLTAIAIRNNPCRYRPAGVGGMEIVVQ